MVNEHPALRDLLLGLAIGDAFGALCQSVLLGGDVDSIAAVTTGILAGRWGLDSIPDWMQRSVEREGIPS